MAKSVYELGMILGVAAEALGVPGQRTFRINVHSQSGAARIWIEKEQLQALSAAIEQLLTELAQVRGFTRGEGTSLPFPGTATVELHVGRITLGYEQDRDAVTVTAYENLLSVEDLESEGDDDPDSEPEGDQIQFEASRELMHTFSRQALEVCAAGRPRCPLCGTPLDGPTHFCPRSNGHAPITRDDE